MDIKETKKFTDKVDGWLSDKEGELLFDLAKNCTGKGVIVEIGSWKGKSTIWLGNGSKSGNKIMIYAIDPHTGFPEIKKKVGEIYTFEEFKNNIKNANIDDIVVPIKKTSKEAADNFIEPIELIFIDGIHEYEHIRMDFEAWFPKVIDGGTMAFHDTVLLSGPRKIMSKFVYRSRFFKNVKFIDSITYCKKVNQNFLSDKIKNRFILLIKNVYGLFLIIHIPKKILITLEKLVKII